MGVEIVFQKYEQDGNIQTIEHDGKLLAHIYRSGLRTESVRFLTPDFYTLQLGLIERTKGDIIIEHGHNPNIEYKVDTTQEFLYLEKGRLLVKISTDTFEPVSETVLEAGDFILLVGGTHGFEMLEDCRIIEVKQGPYPGDEIAKFYRS